MFKIESNQAAKLFTWFVPIGNYVMAFMLWLWLIEPETNGVPFANYIYLVVLFVLAYEFGYKIYYKGNRARHFTFAYVIPLLAGIVGGIGLYLSAK